jgi:hypothetical protein
MITTVPDTAKQSAPYGRLCTGIDYTDTDLTNEE